MPKNATTKSVEALENPPGSKNIHWRTVNLEATETLDANAGERDERGRGRSPIGNSAVQGGLPVPLNRTNHSKDA